MLTCLMFVDVIFCFIYVFPFVLYRLSTISHYIRYISLTFPMAQYSLFVLKVSLNNNIQNHHFYKCLIACNMVGWACCDVSLFWWLLCIRPICFIAVQKYRSDIYLKFPCISMHISVKTIKCNNKSQLYSLKSVFFFKSSLMFVATLITHSSH